MIRTTCRKGVCTMYSWEHENWRKSAEPHFLFWMSTFYCRLAPFCHPHIPEASINSLLLPLQEGEQRALPPSRSAFDRQHCFGSRRFFLVRRLRKKNALLFQAWRSSLGARSSSCRRLLRKCDCCNKGAGRWRVSTRHKAGALPAREMGASLSLLLAASWPPSSSTPRRGRFSKLAL